MAGHCEQSNKPLGSINDKEISSAAEQLAMFYGLN
jgi:hypothetical protein